MNILVDTSVWSIALRRHQKVTEKEKLVSNELSELINESRAVIIGPVRQELLSGIVSDLQFSQLKSYLKSFVDLPIELNDYEAAAELFNHSRKNGVQGSHIDFLICAVAVKHSLPIFTMDKDFNHYSKYIQINLYEPRVTI